MTKIKDRGVNSFEIECIAISQVELRKEPLYLKLLKERKDAEEQLTLEVLDKIANLRQLEYEVGWFDGQAFENIAIKKLNEVADDNPN